MYTHINCMSKNNSFLVYLNTGFVCTSYISDSSWAILGAFSKLREATISSVITVYPRVCMDNSAPTGRIFLWNMIFLVFFRNSVEKIQISLQSGITGILHVGLCRPTFMTYLAEFYLE